MEEGTRQLSERARQVTRAMLRQRHDNGDYVYLSPADLAEETGLSRGTVSQIIGRLRNLGWLEDFREQGGGDRLSRFSRPGGDQALEVLAGHGPAPRQETVQPMTVAYLEQAVREGREPPAVLAAVRRALAPQKK